MSDDQRRAYLLGDSPTLHGNLPGLDTASPVDHLGQTAPSYAFAAMPRPYKNRNDPPWQQPLAGARTGHSCGT